MPERIQLCRTKGWRKPGTVVVVSRPTKWGNPWTINEWVEHFHRLARSFTGQTPTRQEAEDFAREIVVELFREAMEDRLADPDYLEHEADGFYPPLEHIRSELRGRDLACWCPRDQPCHADVLLEIANQEAVP
jgi:hypothetical protein